MGILIGLNLYSCASIGYPDGGPIDETPPRFLRSTPEMGTLNNTRTRIVLEFDEYIKLEKPNEKVVISPPQVKQPEIKAAGKRITVNLLDTLKTNTTYTIDFSDGIVDNNEGNPLGDFTFVFSTGDVIDTLSVSGIVLTASNLEPIKGILVGLQSNLADSAFISLPLERVSRTDSRGQFNIRGIAPGEYRLFALEDGNQNYYFDQKSERIAFYDSIVIPRFEERNRQDTLWKDSLTVDTIYTRKYTHYLPDDLLLRAFEEENNVQYLGRSERLSENKFSIYFSAPADTLPVLKGLNFNELDAFVIERNLDNDTIHYWLKDSLIYKMDTLQVSLTYLYTDTLSQLSYTTDTLRLAMRKSNVRAQTEESSSSSRRRRQKDKEEEPEDEPITFLNVKVNAPSTMDVFGSLYLEFEEPLVHLDSSAIHLRKKIDTLWVDVPLEMEHNPYAIRSYEFYTEWEPQGEYEFVVDSASQVGIYGLFNDHISQTIRVRSLDDYGAIFINLHGADSTAVVELLNAQDNVVRRLPVDKNGSADFYYLQAGTYFARMFFDRNGNGLWDTGNHEEDLQPEEVYYYPQSIELKALWEMEQDWNIKAIPVDKQKPDEIKKQKPDEDKSNKQKTMR
ncbi:MAG: Ig-like domain-containing protein [Bacteroides sp.]|nr:Ig-like domain-containing protein [Bacteroides sp.]